MTTNDCSYRHRLDKVTLAIDALNEAGNKALYTAYELSKERDEIYAQIIQAETLLAGSWHFRSIKNDDLMLESARYDEKFSPTLQKLLSPDYYHDSYSFWDGIGLYFDDGTVTLRIPQDKASEFIIAHHIEVDLDVLIKNRNSLTAKLMVAEKLLTDMQALKQGNTEC